MVLDVLLYTVHVGVDANIASIFVFVLTMSSLSQQRWAPTGILPRHVLRLFGEPEPGQGVACRCTPTVSQSFWICGDDAKFLSVSIILYLVLYLSLIHSLSLLSIILYISFSIYVSFVLYHSLYLSLYLFLFWMFLAESGLVRLASLRSTPESSNFMTSDRCGLKSFGMPSGWSDPCPWRFPWQTPSQRIRQHGRCNGIIDSSQMFWNPTSPILEARKAVVNILQQRHEIARSSLSQLHPLPG